MFGGLRDTLVEKCVLHNKTTMDGLASERRDILDAEFAATIAANSFEAGAEWMYGAVSDVVEAARMSLETIEIFLSETPKEQIVLRHELESRKAQLEKALKQVGDE